MPFGVSWCWVLASWLHRSQSRTSTQLCHLMRSDLLINRPSQASSELHTRFRRYKWDARSQIATFRACVCN